MKKNGNAKWHITAAYFDFHGNELKVNTCKRAASAVARAFDHMQRDDYGARTVQVYDDKVLHAEIVRTPRSVRTTFKRDPLTGE